MIVAPNGRTLVWVVVDGSCSFGISSQSTNAPDFRVISVK